MESRQPEFSSCFLPVWSIRPGLDVGSTCWKSRISVDSPEACDRIPCPKFGRFIAGRISGLRAELSWLERVADNDEVPGSNPGVRIRIALVKERSKDFDFSIASGVVI